MAYDLKRVQNEFKEVCANAGTPCIVPIKLNGRLTTTLGRVSYHSDDGGSYWYPTLVEFSKQLLETTTDETIHGVILHEAAHYIVVSRTHEDHGHDKLFKEVCAEIGTTNDKSQTKVVRTVATSDVYKYQVYCPTCDRIMGKGYMRMCHTLKILDHCVCSKCGGGNLQLIQNW